MINQQGTDKDALNDDISDYILKAEPKSPQTLMKQRDSSHEEESNLANSISKSKVLSQ